MECYCCRRRGVLPLNCNCERLTCRNCLKCAAHCGCGRKPNRPACAKPANNPSTLHREANAVTRDEPGS